MYLHACILQVAKELQAVCRRNPRKARASCTKDGKMKAKLRTKPQELRAVEALQPDCVIDLESDDDIEIVAVLAMDQDSSPCFGRGYVHGMVWVLSTYMF